MIYPVYSLRDRLKGYEHPMLADNDPMAVRYLHQAYSSENSLYRVSPEDYSIYRIGDFNTETGELVAVEKYKVASCEDFERK